MSLRKCELFLDALIWSSELGCLCHSLLSKRNDLGIKAFNGEWHNNH